MLWQTDRAFSKFYSRVLSASPFETFFWECPPTSRKATTTGFEHVTVGSDRPFHTASPSAFAAYLDSATGSVVRFETMGGDATLVAPREEVQRQVSCRPSLPHPIPLYHPPSHSIPSHSAPPGLLAGVRAPGRVRAWRLCRSASGILGRGQLLSRPSSVLPSSCAAVLPCGCAPALLCFHAVVVLCCRAVVLPCCRAAVLLYCSAAALPCSCTVVLLYAQQCGSTTVHGRSSARAQQYRGTIVQGHNSTGAQ